MNEEVKSDAVWSRLGRWLTKNRGINAVRIFFSTFWIAGFIIPEVYAYYRVIPPVSERHVTSGIAKLKRTKQVADRLIVNDIQFSCGVRGSGCISEKDRDFVKNSLVTVEWFESREFPLVDFNRVISIRSQGIDILTEQRSRDLLAKNKENSPGWMLFLLLFFIVAFILMEWINDEELANKKLAENRSYADTR